ncbi:MAG: hypothetical protein WDM92_00275 [Caulobacteraceae bacterium]
MPPHDDAPSQPAAAPGLSAAGGQAVDPAAVTPAIRFEPDGYVLNGPRLMGRQVAGNAFLRAAVAGRGEQPMWAYTPFEKSARAFAELVQELDPGAPRPAGAGPTGWTCWRSSACCTCRGRDLGQWSRLRLRVGPAAYSLCGVTHTTASHAAMDAITDLLSAPVMPWDALICTSSAVLDTVQVVLEAEAASLRWRFGPEAKLTRPQLPVIPLGVHCADFEIAEDERAAARAALGVAPDEVVALFVGRLSFHAKAHPHPMYVGLQKAAERSGRKLVLIQCGWFASEFIEASIKAGAEHTCPDVPVPLHRRQGRGRAAAQLGRRRPVHLPFRQRPGDLRPDSGRGDGGRPAGRGDRLGRLQGHGAPWRGRLPHPDLDAAPGSRRPIRHGPPVPASTTTTAIAGSSARPSRSTSAP